MDSSGSVSTEVRASIDVDLSLPRHVENITESDKANAIKIQDLELLHQEAMKVFCPRQ